MSDKRKIGIIHITLYNFVAKLIFSIFLFGVSAYASRNLTSYHLGMAQYITWMVNFAWLVFNFGGVSTLQRYIASAYMQQHKYALRRYLVFGCWIALLSILMAIGAVYAYSSLDPDEMPYPAMIGLIITQFATGYLQVVVQSMFKYRVMFYVNLLVSVLGFSFLMATIQTHQVEAYVWTYILVNTIQVFCYLIVIIQQYLKFAKEVSHDPEPAPASISTLLTTCLYFGTSAILASVLWQRPELYFIKQYLGFNQIAEYSIALNCILLLLEPIKMLAGAMQSYFAGMSHLPDELKDRFFVFSKHYTWLAIFAGLFLWVESETIVTFLYTSRYVSSAAIVKILLFGFIPGMCTHLVMLLFVGLKRTRFLVIQDSIVALVFVGMLLGSYTIMSNQTLAWIKAIAFNLSFAVAIWYMVKRVHFPFPLVEMLKSVLLSLVILGVVGLIPGKQIEYAALRFMIAFGFYLMLSLTIGLVERPVLSNVWNEGKRMMGWRKG